SRRTYAAIGLLLAVVVVFLGGNSVTTYLTTRWENEVMSVASDWVEAVPGATVNGVSLQGATFDIRITSPEPLPPTAELLADLDGRVPNGFQVAVTDTRGQTIDVGTVGGGEPSTRPSSCGCGALPRVARTGDDLPISLPAGPDASPGERMMTAS